MLDDKTYCIYVDECEDNYMEWFVIDTFTIYDEDGSGERIKPYAPEREDNESRYYRDKTLDEYKRRLAENDYVVDQEDHLDKLSLTGLTEA